MGITQPHVSFVEQTSRPIRAPPILRLLAVAYWIVPQKHNIVVFWIVAALLKIWSNYRHHIIRISRCRLWSNQKWRQNPWRVWNSRPNGRDTLIGWWPVTWPFILIRLNRMDSVRWLTKEKTRLVKWLNRFMNFQIFKIGRSVLYGRKVVKITAIHCIQVFYESQTNGPKRIEWIFGLEDWTESER